jgi:hypothetical protein
MIEHLIRVRPSLSGIADAVTSMSSVVADTLRIAATVDSAVKGKEKNK